LALAVMVGLWLARRRIGRGPLVGVLILAGGLLPALGFINVYPMRFSFVADHFQYLPSLGLIALFAAGVTRLLGRLRPEKKRLAMVSLVALLGLFGVLSWKQGQIYRDEETLWRDTLAKNPRSIVARNNFSDFLAAQGRDAEAREQSQAARKLEEALYRKALARNPDSADIHTDLGVNLGLQGRRDEALTHLRTALRLKPDDADTNYNLGNTLVQADDLAAGLPYIERALQVNPQHSRAHNTMAVIRARQGDLDAAIEHLQQAVRIESTNLSARMNLSMLLERQGRLPEALEQAQRAQKTMPNNTVIRQRVLDLQQKIRGSGSR
jgi:tetratricopeptide (TPR) repeat protein